jgi:hypothetical protein
MIDDGYTEYFTEGVWFRRLLQSEVQELVRLITEDGMDEAERLLFSPPHVFNPAGRPFGEFEKQNLFQLLVENKTEDDDFENLKQAGSLAFTDPLLFIRSCEICQKFWMNHETGKIVKSGEECLPRPSHVKVPCEAGTFCKKGHHGNPLVLSEKNQKAWKFWLRWHRVGCPYQDAIIQKHWNFFGTLKENHGLPSVHAEMA